MDAIELGATLYMPATRPDLVEILSGRHPNLMSAVLCLEDSIRLSEVQPALANLARLLRWHASRADQIAKPALFVRPRDRAMLTRILRFEGVDTLTGFVIPKASPDNFPAYLDCLSESRHLLMPTLESPQLLDETEIRRLRDQLLAVQSRILAVRIGGNDLLQAIGARRSKVRTAYEGPLGAMIARFVSAFASYNFSLSAPVFEHFGNPALLRAEVERDVEHGLLTKTAIHPRQIEIIQDAYAVDLEMLREADAIVRGGASAVFSSRGSMCEPETHRKWAFATIRRAELFGVMSPTSGVMPRALVKR